MLHWIIIIVLVAGILSIVGFGGLAGAFSHMVQFLAMLFVLLFVAIIIYSAARDQNIEQ